MRPCTPHNLHSPAQAIETAALVASLPATEYSERGRAKKEKQTGGKLYNFVFFKMGIVGNSLFFFNPLMLEIGNQHFGLIREEGSFSCTK